MSDYLCATRTNYFHVKDSIYFKDVLKHISSEDDIRILEQRTESGDTLYGFGVYGPIYGYKSDNEEEEDYEVDYVYKKLQKCVTKNDAIIILSSGHEKLKYVGSGAVCITCDKIEYLDMIEVAQRKAAEMLGNPEFQTQCDY